MSCEHWTQSDGFARASLYAACPWCEISLLREAVRQAIEGHEVWESIYGSSPDSRAHGAFLRAALNGSPPPQEAPLCPRHGQIVETGCTACEAALGRTGVQLSREQP